MKELWKRESKCKWLNEWKWLYENVWVKVANWQSINKSVREINDWVRKSDSGWKWLTENDWVNVTD